MRLHSGGRRSLRRSKVRVAMSEVLTAIGSLPLAPAAAAQGEAPISVGQLEVGLSGLAPGSKSNEVHSWGKVQGECGRT